MLKKINLWGVIACLALCSPLYSCPTDLNIQSALNQSDQTALVSIAEQLLDCPDSLAMVYHKISVLYYFENDFDEAIFFIEKALDIRTEIYKYKPHVDLGRSYFNLGGFYKKTSDFLLAKYNFEKAAGIFKELDVRRRLRNSQYELGALYQKEGDFQKSETLLNFLINSSLAKEAFFKAECLVVLANTYRVQYKYELAKEALEEAIAIFIKGPTITKAEAQAHLNLGIVYYELKEYKQAIDHYGQAIEIFLPLKAKVELARAFNNKGLAFLKNENYESAKNNIDKGLAEALSINQILYVSQSHDNLGELYLNKQEYEKANVAFSHALQSLIPLLSAKNSLDGELKEALQQSPHKIDLLVYLSDKTRALKALYDKIDDEKHLLDALLYLEIGDYLIDQLRQNHNDQSTKLFWRQEVLPFYEKAIEICTLLEDPNKAFFYFEKSKSILLLEALLSSNALQSIPDSLQREVKYLEREIRLQRENLNQVKEENKAAVLKSILDQEEKLDALNAALIEQYPQLKELSQQHQLIDLNHFNQAYLLGKQRALIHYFYGAENVYALVVRDRAKQVIRLGGSSQITDLVRAYLQYFEQADRIESQPKAYLEQAGKVYAMLIKPLGLSPQTELLVIPAGILTYLPFEALITDTKPDYGIANAPYMLLQHKLWYAFSATLFDQLERRTVSETTKSLLAFAPFANTSTTDYSALNFSQDELSSINQIVSMDLYQDKQASLKVFLSDQADYNVLHLSTHAFSSFSETQPFIVFSDSILTLADLYQYPISANLVVLSACQTQIGKLAVGEGVLGLNRGFFYAGARSVVSSLWNMNAQSTSTILSNFYQSMADGTPKYLALSQAKTVYLLNENIPSFQKSPYYWAGMNYYGDSEQWSVKKATAGWKYGLVLLVLVLGGFWFKAKR